MQILRVRVRVYVCVQVYEDELQEISAPRSARHHFDHSGILLRIHGREFGCAGFFVKVPCRLDVHAA